MSCTLGLGYSKIKVTVTSCGRLNMQVLMSLLPFHPKPAKVAVRLRIEEEDRGEGSRRRIKVVSCQVLHNCSEKEAIA